MDQRIVIHQWPPRRIISLVPSQTELLYDLGLNEEVVGITKFCIHPAHWFADKKRIGGTKTLNLQKIDDLKPDLIIGNREENTREQIEVLSERYPVWMSEVNDLDSALEMIRGIGSITDRPAKAASIAQEINDRFSELSNLVARQPRRVRAAYLIWRKPFMVAASGTFVHHMMELAGLDNTFTHLSRYPEVAAVDLQAANPEWILLSSEPYPFQEKHINEIQEHCPNSRVILVNGEMFSWYGSRLLHSAQYFREIMSYEFRS